MPSFDTAGPVSATVELVTGDVRISTGPHPEAVVDVRPANAADDLDVRAAAQTRVEYASGRLQIRGARQRGLGILSKVGSVEVTVTLPDGSTLDGKLGVGSVSCTGRLADCRLSTGAGDLQIQDAGTLKLHTGLGAAFAESVAGDAEITTGSGRLHVRTVGGRAALKNGNGDTWIGAAQGDLRISAANGAIAAEHAAAAVTANTANGDIRIGELVRGSATLRAGAGRIVVGIRSGTAARLDLHTHFGNVRNELDAADGPDTADEKAEVRARTGFGDIVIHRS
jgi:DUF4097 and DUF4098 domain-containing protein YvlB